MPELFLAIDLGTSSCKSTLFDRHGCQRARAAFSYPTYRPSANQAEQSADDWWQAVICTVRDLAEQVSDLAGDVMVIGVTGQMHALVCVNAAGDCLRPSMTLNDRRATVELQVLSDEWDGGRGIYAVSGERPDPSLPMAKLLWLRRHEPEVFSQTSHFLACKDYIRLRLTGQVATDVLDAAATGLADIRTGDWAPGLIDAVGVMPSRLPPILPAATIAGTLTGEAARALRLREGTPVAVGAGDDVDLVGAGMAQPGFAYEHLGSTGSLLVCADAPKMDWGSGLEVYPHLVPGCWVVGGSTSSAGAALKWATELFQEPADLAPGDVVPGSQTAEALLFLPYLSGERCPVWAPHARGAFVGLSMGHSRSDMVRAVYEGVAFSQRHVLDAILGLDIRPVEIRVAGGTTTQHGWGQLRAAVYGLPLVALSQTDPTALGVMIVSAVAVGVHASIEEAMQQLVTVSEVIAPDDQLVANYRSLYGRYRRAAEHILAYSGP